MQCIQILDEASLKNVSIVRITEIIAQYKFKNIQHVILTSKKKLEIKNSKIKLISFSNYFHFIKILFLLKKKDTRVVHIHGMWSFFNLLISVYCKLLEIPIIIQPHGMLLDGALKSKSWINYLTKICVIKFIYKILYAKKEYFIAVTKEEQYSIRKFFPLSFIKVIQNPFQIIPTVAKKINKNFIFFGRYNRHKNIDKIILAFNSANLGKEWSLDIYGIDDDDNYKKYLKKLADENNYKNIYFKKPIFDPLKKFKVLSEAWCNILISKSEVLSLSVLEAMSVGTKSLINKKIFYPSWIKKNSLLSNPEINDLALKLKTSIKTGNKNKFIEKKKIVNIFNKNYNFLNSKKNYLNLINLLINIKKKYVSKYNFKYLISNFFNSSHIPIIILICVFNERYTLASEIGIVPGVYFLMLQLLSGNARTIILYQLSSDSFFFRSIYFRIFFGFWLLLILSIFLYFNNTLEYKLFLFLLSLIAYLSWISDLIISFNEKYFIKFVSYFYIFFYFLLYLFLNIGLSSNLANIYDIFSIFILVKFIFLTLNVEILDRNIISVKKNIYFLFKKIMPFASSFFNIIAVISWRASIFFVAPKDYAGILFASFALASFPGTFFNNFMGQMILINKNFKNLLIKYYKIIYLLSLSIIIGLIFYVSNYYILNNKIFYDFFYFALISIVGTHIMLLALYSRHNELYAKKNNKNLVFKKDIIYGILIAPIIVILEYLFGVDYIGYAYLVSSIIALFVYKLKN